MASSPCRIPTNGFCILIGSNSGYAQLWGAVQNITRNSTTPNNRELGPWVRLDLAGELDMRDTTEVVVTMAGQGGRMFLGYPIANNERGIVRAFNIGPTNSSSFVSFANGEDSEVFTGENDGDHFGKSLSTNINGQFVAIGASGGGYVRALVNWRGTAWEIAGEPIHASGLDSNFGSSVATGIILYGGCDRCAFQLDGTRIVVSSPGSCSVNGTTSIYQFVSDSNRWMQIGDIPGDGVEDNGQEPSSVTMSADSGVIAAGCPHYGDRSGRVVIYNILVSPES